MHVYRHKRLNKSYPCSHLSWCLILVSFIFRVKVLVLSLWQAMSVLTACLTSWSTSLSTTVSASTSSVLVSVSCMLLRFSPQAERWFVCFIESQAFPQGSKHIASYFTHFDSLGQSALVVMMSKMCVQVESFKIIGGCDLTLFWH